MTILRTRRLYKCKICMAFYENRGRSERCHNGDIGVFEVTMKRLKDYHKKRTD
jgi:hypothetical protein